MNHGRTSQFNWNEIQAEFEKISNTKVYSFRVLKNKYDDQRKDYNLWTSLKNGATGLGWDASTGTLNCSDEWWEIKQTENDKFKRLRKKQPSLELQECWYQLFGDKVATGVEVVAPSITRRTFVAPPVNPSTSNDSHHVNLDAEDEDLEAENGLEDLDAENETFFSSFIDEVASENVSTSNQIGGSKLAKKSAKTSTKPAQMKRSGRESAGTAMFKKIMTEQNATQQRALQLLELDTTNEVSKTNVDSVITVMNRMVEQKLLPEYGDLWCFGMTVLEDPVKREFFLNFPADAGRVAWLQYQQKLGK
ncbi:myb/SANT-like domain-containing protein [Artemisia annua]|nr:myb/SANT-like domain-containing protein [Artemisia annua]